MSEHPAGQGGLAQVVATRGGRATPEAPFVIEHREALIYMLCEAAELEHAIMCQYLYAAFSLKRSTDEGLSLDELRAVEKWRRTVSHIATQEMLHLALVQNVLSAVGAAPHFTRPNLPQPAGHYPPGVVLTLLPFGDEALRHFMFLERPEGMDLDDAGGLAAVERAAPVMQEGEIVPRLQDFATVGHLYRSIEEGIKHLCAKYGEPWLFVGPTKAQASEEHFGWAELVEVSDAASAQKAIDTILDQGEGPRGHWRKAHFGQFVEILDEFLELKQANEAFEPTRPVLPATVRPSKGEQTMPLIGDPFTARCTDLFNVGYEILLQTLERYFAHTEETDEQLTTLAQLTLGLMFKVIKPLGVLVSALPVGVEAPGRSAGPSFELFYESDYLLPHRDAAWALIEERLREAAAFAERLLNEGPSAAAELLEPIGPALLSLAHTLARSRADWGGPDHASDVTVAHRRKDAEEARRDQRVADQVQEVVSAIENALQIEQSRGLLALFAAASLDPETARDARDNDLASKVHAWKRGLLTEAERRFDDVANLADLLVAVNGETELKRPDFTVVTDVRPIFCLETIQRLIDQTESAGVYEDIAALVSAVPPGALLVDPHPSRMTSPVEKHRPIPAVVDRASALAVLDRIIRDRAAEGRDGNRAIGEPPGLQQIADGLGSATNGTHDGVTGRDVVVAYTRASEDAAPTEAGNVTAHLAGLFRESCEVLFAVLGSSVSSAPDVVVARHNRRDIVSRLLHSVLRPLADVCSPPENRSSLLLAEFQPAGRSNSNPLAQRLRSLALTATHLRTDIPIAFPELLEVTAALQDLACRCIEGGEPDRAAFLEQCRRIQTELPRSIQLVRNGPYVLTNVARIENGLGEPIASRPQMALCRCGRSGSKPWCDGSHARADFSGAKDPNRVADRRDTYEGPALTVLDNRGICQHAGFCSDRLPIAFRVGEEPFVAPNGARMDEVVRAVRACPSGALSFALDRLEARESVDWHCTRGPAVAVTKDGPYRITGAIPFLDENGAPVTRNLGSSLEHYALCRCGHSQNKPFCSGMHWYVDFRDPPQDLEREPTLFEWCGGLPALTRLTEIFYERYAPEDPLLAPLFANVSPDHPERVAKWLGEVFGGPPCYSEEYGAGLAVLDSHLGQLTEEERARWVELFVRSAGDATLPNDPEFCSAFASCIEWGSRFALHASAAGSAQPERLPTWNWGPAGPPARRVSPGPPDETEQAPAVLPGPEEPVSFDSSIKALFRQRDRQSMSFAFDLWSYDDVKDHAPAIAERLRAGTMPCDGPWAAEKIDLFQRWVDDGMRQ